MRMRVSEMEVGLRDKGFIYCAHITTRENYERMHGSTIDPPFERHMKRIVAHGVYSYMDQDFDTPYEVTVGDYPGVYMDLVYDMDAMFQKMRKFKMNTPDTVIIVFPLELLDTTKHWHFNLCDRCGTIGYDTYFPDTIGDLPHIRDILAYYPENEYCNEIVFHKSVAMSYRSKVFTFDSEGVEEIIDISLEIVNGQGVSEDAKPANYIFYSDNFYNGTDTSYYNQPDVMTTSDDFYIGFIRRHLPEKYKHLCDSVTTKSEMEDALCNCLVMPECGSLPVDLITYVHTR